jgi:hypothetical protein
MFCFSDTSVGREHPDGASRMSDGLIARLWAALLATWPLEALAVL